MPFLRMETISSLIEGFLRKPVVEIRLSDSAEVEQLRSEIEQLRKENVQVLKEDTQSYNQVDQNLRLEDFLRHCGINPREVK